MNVTRKKIASAAVLDTYVRQREVYGITITGEVALNGAKDFCIEVLPASENDDIVLQRQIIPGVKPVIYVRSFDGTDWGDWVLRGENALFDSPTITTSMKLDFAKAAAGTTEVVTVGEDGALSKEVKGTAFNKDFGTNGTSEDVARADHTHIDVNYEILGTAGEAITLGSLCFMEDGKWYLSDAQEPGWFKLLGYAVSAADALDDDITIRIMGVIPNVGAMPGMKAWVGQSGGFDLFGALEGEKSRCLGWAITATAFFFNPDKEFTVVPTEELDV